MREYLQQQVQQQQYNELINIIIYQSFHFIYQSKRHFEMS